MSGKISGLCWDLDLPHNELLVLLALADHTDHEGNNAWPSLGLLAWKTGYSESTVRRCLQSLEKKKIVAIQSRDGDTNLYSVRPKNGKQKNSRQNDTPSIAVTPPPSITMTPHPYHSCDTQTVIEPSLTVNCATAQNGQNPPTLSSEIPILDDSVESNVATSQHLKVVSNGLSNERLSNIPLLQQEIIEPPLQYEPQPLPSGNSLPPQSSTTSNTLPAWCTARCVSILVSASVSGSYKPSAHITADTLNIGTLVSEKLLYHNRGKYILTNAGIEFCQQPLIQDAIHRRRKTTPAPAAKPKAKRKSAQGIESALQWIYDAIVAAWHIQTPIDKPTQKEIASVCRKLAAKNVTGDELPKLIAHVQQFDGATYHALVGKDHLNCVIRKATYCEQPTTIVHTTPVSNTPDWDATVTITTEE